MIDDGVIKFSFSEFLKTKAVPLAEFESLELQRKRLFEYNLIGEYLPEKIGFGNISIRKDYISRKESTFPQFIITGTQTGALKDLTGEHYTRVVDGDLNSQSIGCHGPIEASSESLTHGAMYLASEKIKAIVHIHHKQMWEEMLKKDFPRTKDCTSYGTSEMAHEAMNLIKGKEEGVLVMHGHQDGIIFYGQSIEEATELTLKHYFLIVSEGGSFPG
tara:strand:- start:28448 stop:29098 length:651 start_codon:yes stop_codon:yes gene_type:complete